MNPLTIALLQMAAEGTNQQRNLEKAASFCRKAARMGADIALFPEMWSNGYFLYDPHGPLSLQGWKEMAIEANGNYIRYFRALAHELNIAIGATYLEQFEPLPRNSFSLIDRQGEVVLQYSKVHTCDFNQELYLTRGESFPVAALETAQGAVNIGAMICYDREFPESARILMLNGAEIILVPNACEMNQNRLYQLRTRAYENMVGIAMTNYAAPQNNGHSIAFDGIDNCTAAGSTEKPHDMLIVEAGETEGIYLAHFDLEQLRAYREREIWGNAFRRPGLYGALQDPAIGKPFRRERARR